MPLSRWRWTYLCPTTTCRRRASWQCRLAAVRIAVSRRSTRSAVKNAHRLIISTSCIKEYRAAAGLEPTPFWVIRDHNRPLRSLPLIPQERKAFDLIDHFFEQGAYINSSVRYLADSDF